MSTDPPQRIRSSRWGDLDLPAPVDLDGPTERELKVLALVDAAIATLTEPRAPTGINPLSAG